MVYFPNNLLVYILSNVTIITPNICHFKRVEYISRIILRNEITRLEAICICNYESYSHVALHKGNNNLCSRPVIYEPTRA